MSVSDSLAALPSYSSENGSLDPHPGLPLRHLRAGHDRLPVRLDDPAHPRHRRAARPRRDRLAVLRDTVGQAAILLAVGAAVGGVVGGAGGAALATVAPFESSAVTVLLPVAGVLVIGLLGSVLATRRVTRVDPLLALGGN